MGVKFQQFAESSLFLEFLNPRSPLKPKKNGFLIFLFLFDRYKTNKMVNHEEKGRGEATTGTDKLLQCTSNSKQPETVNSSVGPPPPAPPAAAVVAPGWPSRKVSPPEDARLLKGFGLVAEMDRWTPLCPWSGDCAFTAGVAAGMLHDRELPDRDPSLSGYNKKKNNQTGTEKENMSAVGHWFNKKHCFKKISTRLVWKTLSSCYPPFCSSHK